MGRSLVVFFACVLLVALLAPGTVAAGSEPAGAETLSVPDGTEIPALDRLRSTTASPGLSRADTEDVLEQPTRAAIYEGIEDAPGRTLAELAATVGVTKSTVRYHVGVLREAGLVEAAEVAGALRFAPAHTDPELVATLRAEGTGTVLDAVATHEPASVTTLAEATDRAPSTVSYHLAALEDRGLVERERVGEAVMTRLASDTRSAMTGVERATADD